MPGGPVGSKGNRSLMMPSCWQCSSNGHTRHHPRLRAILLVSSPNNTRVRQGFPENGYTFTSGSVLFGNVFEYTSNTCLSSIHFCAVSHTAVKCASTDTQRGVLSSAAASCPDHPNTAENRSAATTMRKSAPGNKTCVSCSTICRNACPLGRMLLFESTPRTTAVRIQCQY